MKYLVLLMADGELAPWAELTEAEQGALMERFEGFSRACAARDGDEILAGEELDPESATTVRTRGGRLSLTDGPFAEAVEQLGGFFLVEAPDLDVLVELLRELPAYDMQISPVMGAG